MTGNCRYTINMANSIVGVSILSMPYCFKEVGLLLGVILLVFCSFITKKTCMYLIRAAIMSRRRSYEFLALSAWGGPGKLVVEIAMVLFLVGIGVSFHVVMGDLLPNIVASALQINISAGLRASLLLGIVLLVVLPLCLLRNIDSLASMSTCSICFYVALVAVIMGHALPRVLDGSWLEGAVWANWSNVFQVLPIMCLALACQSNVFEIYDSLPDANVSKMRDVVSGAMNLSATLYAFVGIFGCIAFGHSDKFGGNVILAFPATRLTEAIKLFFVASIAISFPLLLFPCRTSIYSLLYRRNLSLSQDLVGNYMPETRFKLITFVVLGATLCIGILLPNIEFVLGLLGSTLGALISLIFPALLFIRMHSKLSLDRLLAQGVLLLGVVVVVTGCYQHLAADSPPHQDLPSVRLPPFRPPPFPAAPLPSEADGELRRLEPVAPEPPVVDKQDPPGDNKQGGDFDEHISPVELKKEGGIDKQDPPVDLEERELRAGQAESKLQLPESRNRSKPFAKTSKKQASRFKKENEVAKKEEVEADKEREDDLKDKLHRDKENEIGKQSQEESKDNNVEKEDDLARQEKLLQEMAEQNKEHQRILAEEKVLLKQLQEQQQQLPVNVAAQQLVVSPQQLPLPADNLQQQLDVQLQPFFVQQQNVLSQQQPIVAQQQPIVAQQQPIVAQQQPIEAQQQPIVAQQQPIVAQQQPIVAQQQPVVDQQQQVVAQQQPPIVAQQQPVVAQQQPVVAQQQPMVAQQQPIVAQQQPVVDQQQPMIAQQPSSASPKSSPAVVKAGHDEERRRRRHAPVMPEAGVSAPLLDNSLLSLNAALMDRGALEGIGLQAHLASPRQLLWLNRRKKKRRPQDPDYPDEM
ncbi:putative sodium-coupled neutral amino acid transporter 10 isoform X2 [Hyalella azteca]|uniref:Sodium-coupled neutral amino acid transporter 10 isoform X1 n=1 Tax=Hyalella azteca TaxID=294128 RepID=A0A8B7N6X4_HYAAZ|nr:putative sodium-coupled neutral amino acid transporter 10 isoform X1 [Hyalella azteca]XP_047738335.1 putative sodium-coupled neutral amino acid transporter 10 isoform X2 [Hyalella azteca]